MRINSEEAMVKAIRAKREAKVDWVEFSRRSRAKSCDDGDAKVTAAKIAGA